MNGKKYDGEKPSLYLLPPKALVEVGKVLTFGAQKYDENNWKKLDNLQNRYSGAALRHIFSHMDGEELDSETGLDHLAHAVCCLLFKLEAKLDGEKSKEKGRGESLVSKYSQSNWTASPYKTGRQTYNKERSLRDSEYSVQYYTSRQDYCGLSGTYSVHGKTQENEQGQACKSG